MPASPTLKRAPRWGADPLAPGEAPLCLDGRILHHGACCGQWVHRRGAFRGREWGGRALGWGAPGVSPLPRHPTGSGRVSVNRESAAPESEAVALFISRQPGSPPPPLSSNSSFLRRQLVRLPSARSAPGAETTLGREPRAPAWDGVTPALWVHGGQTGWG